MRVKRILTLDEDVVEFDVSMHDLKFLRQVSKSAYYISHNVACLLFRQKVSFILISLVLES